MGTQHGPLSAAGCVAVTAAVCRRLGAFPAVEGRRAVATAGAGRRMAEHEFFGRPTQWVRVQWPARRAPAVTE